MSNHIDINEFEVPPLEVYEEYLESFFSSDKDDEEKEPSPLGVAFLVDELFFGLLGSRVGASDITAAGICQAQFLMHADDLALYEEGYDLAQVNDWRENDLDAYIRIITRFDATWSESGWRMYHSTTDDRTWLCVGENLNLIDDDSVKGMSEVVISDINMFNHIFNSVD